LAIIAHRHRSITCGSVGRRRGLKRAQQMELMLVVDPIDLLIIDGVERAIKGRVETSATFLLSVAHERETGGAIVGRRERLAGRLRGGFSVEVETPLSGGDQ